ncbi:CFEM domain-containing protein [Sarocladium implicatum]|nr:CFEM domain-containing protein [Sarocladium implicatum]
MKTTFVALFAASLASAQQFGGVPECAQKCIQEALPKVGCDVSDTACACESGTQARLRSVVAPCLLSECDSEELVQAQQAGAAQCEQQSSAGSATGTATREDLGTTGTMSILPTDIIVTPPSDSTSTPGGPSITTISSIVTPPSGGNDTTVTQTSTAGDSDETGGAGGDNGGDSEGGDGGDDDSGASSMGTAGLAVALLAAVIAI